MIAVAVVVIRLGNCAVTVIEHIRVCILAEIAIIGEVCRNRGCKCIVAFIDIIVLCSVFFSAVFTSWLT